MPPGPEPRVVVWTDHALAKAEFLGVPRADVEPAVLTGHGSRTRNTGAADRLVLGGSLTVTYNRPAGDELTALVVTLSRHG
jgi:hypothetical protein